MSSYGDYGYGFENNYGYGNSDYGKNSGRNNWQQGNSGSRKRRGNYDQMQQFEQRRGRRWRNNQGGWGDGDDWYGNESYDDGHYGGWKEEDYGYNDGYGNSRKRGRFYDDDPRGGQYMERGPHSVNFYDDYDDSYNRRPSRRGRSWHADSRRSTGNQYNRYYEEESKWGSGSSRYDRRGESYHSRRDSARRPPPRPIRKKSDAEDAVYEKHKKVTVARGKRDKISNTVHAIVTVFKEVASKIAQEEYEKKVSSNNDKVQNSSSSLTVESEEEKKNPVSTEQEAKVESTESTEQEAEVENTKQEAKVESTESTEQEAKVESTEQEAKVESTEQEAKVEITEQDAKVESTEQEAKVESTEQDAKVESTESANTDNQTQPESKMPSEEKKEDVASAGDEKKSELNNETETKNGEKSVTEKPKVHYEPVILSAIKCGESAMRVLVGNALQASVVVITKKKPTLSLVKRVQVLLEESLKMEKRMKDESFALVYDDQQEALLLTQDSVEGFRVIIRFTSPECSSEADANEDEPDPEDILSRESCIKGLVQLRRIRFFFKKLDASPVSLTVLRILLFFRSTLDGWDKMPVWLALLLVNAARITILGDNVDPEQEKDLYKADTLLVRCIEIISSGLLLPDGRGMKDPCEVDKDAASDLSKQEAFSITVSAQRVLRQIYFGKIRDLLGLEAAQ